MATCKSLSVVFIILLLFNYSCTTKKDHSKPAATPAPAIVKKDTSLNGFYTGLEYTGITKDPVYPGKEFKSYHLGYLKIKDDSVFLDQSPIYVYKKDTTYSASDGGFFYYSGTFQKSNTAIVFNLTELFCDYCGVMVKPGPDGKDEVVKRTKKWKATLTDDGFIIDGYLYKKATNKQELISEHSGPYMKTQ